MVGGGGPVAATLAAQPGRRSLIGRATPRPLLPAAPIGHTASQPCSGWLPRRRSRSARSGAIFQAAAAAGEGRGAEERSGGARPGPAPRSARRLRDMAGARRGAQHRGTWGRDGDRGYGWDRGWERGRGGRPGEPPLLGAVGGRSAGRCCGNGPVLWVPAAVTRGFGHSQAVPRAPRSLHGGAAPGRAVPAPR